MPVYTAPLHHTMIFQNGQPRGITPYYAMPLHISFAPPPRILHVHPPYTHRATLQHCPQFHTSPPHPNMPIHSVILSPQATSYCTTSCYDVVGLCYSVVYCTTIYHRITQPYNIITRHYMLHHHTNPHHNVHHHTMPLYLAT
jgi:hypothetical protein